MQLLVLVHWTDFDAPLPNLNFTVLVPTGKPTPVIVTVLPPAAGPFGGETDSITGA